MKSIIILALIGAGNLVRADLLDGLREAPDNGSLIKVIKGLISHPDRADVIAALNRGLHYDDEIMRAHATLTLANLPGVTSVNMIGRMLKDTSGFVRQCASSGLWSGHAHEAKEHPKLFLDATLEDLLHGDLILTLSGVKPISKVRLTGGAFAAQLLDRARREGRISNADLDWFLPDQEHMLAPYSRRAIAKMLADPELIRTLEQHGFPWVGSVDEAVAAFERVLNRETVLPEEDQTVVRKVFFAEPPGPANGPVHRYFPDVGFEQFNDWVRVYDPNGEDVKALDQGAITAIATYHELASKGLSPLEVVNAWPSCAKDLIDF